MTAPPARATPRRRAPWLSAGLALALSSALAACAGSERGAAELAALELGYDPAAVRPFSGAYRCPPAREGRYQTRFRWRYVINAPERQSLAMTAAGRIEVTMEARRAVVHYAITEIELGGRIYAGADPFFTVLQIFPKTAAGRPGAKKTTRTAFGNLDALPPEAAARIRERLEAKAPMGAPFLLQTPLALAMGDPLPVEVPRSRFGAAAEDPGIEQSADVLGEATLDVGPAVVVVASQTDTNKINGAPARVESSGTLFYETAGCAVVGSWYAFDAEFRYEGRPARYRMEQSLSTEGWTEVR